MQAQMSSLMPDAWMFWAGLPTSTEPRIFGTIASSMYLERRIFAICVFGLLSAFSVAGLRAEGLIPVSKLRPSDPSRFFPNLVRFSDEELVEIEAILNQLNRPDLIKHVQKKRSVPELPKDTNAVALLFSARSERLREWTLRSLGETPGDNTPMIPALLEIVANPAAERELRALAARVIGTANLDTRTVATLMDTMRNADSELQMILLEVVAKSGRAGVPFIPELKRYLNAPAAAVQFYAFRAAEQIERDAKLNGDVSGDAHYAKALETVRFYETREPSPDAIRSSALAAKDARVPKYLTCLGLLHLSTAPGPDHDTVDAVLESIAQTDPFVSELAANVLDSFQQFDGQSVRVLSRGLSHSNANVRLHAALALKKSGPAEPQTLPDLIASLNRAGAGGGTAGELGACLDALRTFGTNGAMAAPALKRLLEEQSAVYRNLSKHEVDRVRAFLLVTLADVGIPVEALPFVVSSLASADRWMTMEFAAAARAAATLGTNAVAAVPLLVRPLQEPVQEQPITFEKFDSHFSSTRDYTTSQVEVLRALRQMGRAAEAAAPAVRQFLERPLPFMNSNALMRIPDLRAEGVATLAAIQPRQEAAKE
jgi:hypothetical protein